MARAANDMSQLSNMVVPGFDAIFDSFSSLVITITFIGFISPQLLLAPLLFTAGFLGALWDYSRQLNPGSDRMREQFAEMNAGLTEPTAALDAVKTTAHANHRPTKFYS